MKLKQFQAVFLITAISSVYLTVNADDPLFMFEPRTKATATSTVPLKKGEK